MKKGKDNVKYNTIPHGRILLGIFWAVDIIFIIGCLSLWAINSGNVFMVLPFVVLVTAFIIMFH